MLPVFFPLYLCVCREERYCWQINELEFVQRVVEHQRGEELGFGRGSDVADGEVVGDETLEHEEHYMRQTADRMLTLTLFIHFQYFDTSMSF